ncbi:MAG TPA: DUF192 domain-containing protein [Patescibacteria group bacterium]|nr:DUF192 domain-containing protein [Patescibacteria group bacterium]
MIKKGLLVSLVFCLVSLSLWLVFKPRTAPSIKVMVAGKTLEVEVAQTLAEREKGLSERTSLCSNCGMLFLFDKPGVYPFWMRKMYFDIDIIWIKDSRVVEITAGARCPAKEEFDVPKTIYQSQVPVDKVLEVKAGWAAGNGIKVGDEVSI